MKLKILHYRIFDKLAQTLNFRKTAKELNLSISIVSKKINELESFYNTKLFHRNTRLVCLTEMGNNILPRIKELIQIEEQIKFDLNQPYQFVGNFKIGIPFSFFESMLRKVDLYVEQHPKVCIDWKVGNYLNRLYEENFDVVVFCGPLPDGDFYSKKIGQWQKRVCASPHFLAQHGVPKSLEELAHYSCIDHSENFKSTWNFNHQEYAINLKQKCSSSRLLSNMAINSLGVVYLPSFTVDEDIKNGLLTEILTPFTTKIYDIFLVSKTPFSEGRKNSELLKLFT